jgi:uncharacterized protein
VTGIRPASFALAALAGALFGGGIALAEVTRPATVLAFLDVSGAWDPSLGLAFVVAVLVHAVGLRAIGRRRRPWLDTRFHLPTRRDVDAPLIVGAALFGIGWGLAGVCPTVAVVGAVAGGARGIVFVVAMLAGMRLHRATAR